MSSPASPEREENELEHDELEAELDDDPGLDLAVLRRRRELVLTFFTLALIIAVAAFTAYRIFQGPPDTPEAVRAAAEQAIRNYLGRKMKIQFSAPNETYIESIREGVREVAGSVVAVTEAGQASYYRYRCIVMEDEGHWEPEKLYITPE
jgi:hypothetical protein